MSKAEFYVLSSSGGLVPAKFLQINGAPIGNPNLSSKPYDPNLPRANILFNADYSPYKEQNINGYFIVPVNFNIYSVTNIVLNASADSISPDLTEGIALNFSFLTGGVGDLQRNYEDINGNDIRDGSGSFVQAFTDITSASVGFTAKTLSIPLPLAEAGGGALNLSKYYFVPNIDIGGDLGNSNRNTISMQFGYNLAGNMLFPNTDEASSDSTWNVSNPMGDFGGESAIAQNIRLPFNDAQPVLPIFAQSGSNVPSFDAVGSTCDLITRIQAQNQQIDALGSAGFSAAPST